MVQKQPSDGDHYTTVSPDVPRNQVYDIVTDRIIALLEQGVIPWRKPWATEGPPRNLVSKRAYTGVNAVLLGSLDYERPYFVTFKQAKDLGGHVRRGESGHLVIFWRIVEKEPEDGEDEPETFPILRYYHVFNVAQVEGIEDRLPPLPDPSEIHPIEQAERDLAAVPNPPTVAHDGGQRAYYRRTDDSVHLPKQERFAQAAGYYATYAHELVHSTGHEKRLDRFAAGVFLFASCDYSFEELVAEIGAAILCGRWGIEKETLENSAAYIQGWLKALNDDKRLIVRAASAAQAGVEYILGDEPDGPSAPPSPSPEAPTSMPAEVSR